MFATTVASVGMFVLVEVGWSVPVGPGFVRSLLSVQHKSRTCTNMHRERKL